MSKVMLYKFGASKVLIWGREMLTKVVDEIEVAEHLVDGWVSHPDEVKAPEDIAPESDQDSDEPLTKVVDEESAEEVIAEEKTTKAKK